MQKIKIFGSERRVYKKWQTLAIIREIFDSNLETRRYGPVTGVSRIIRESWQHWLFVPTWKLSGIVWTPIQYVTLHFQDQHIAGLLHYRTHAKITVLIDALSSMVFELVQKLYPIVLAWETSAEISYWWRISTQIRVVLLTGCAAREIWFNQPEAQPRSG